ncbi:hypothetical protein BIW11_05770 [Tropilaelaps mercedesae]|uniref:CRAL-TRIO domain-containing protein n=1 Tax=Tropilaelaps mercedesae TaxID=418985 RepID=A0A1V9Y0X4_9ACAR|nr:hypothetical protein BIW11_05770 [Tropilaelaps mercedesae]
MPPSSPTAMSDWRAVALELHGETEKKLRNAIDDLKECIAQKGREEIAYERNDEFLARFIRASKFDVARAFKMLDGYYLNRATMPQKVAPRGLGPKDTAFYVPLKSLAILDQKNWDGSTVLMFRKGEWEMTTSNVVLSDTLFFGYYAVEVAMRDPLVQLHGLTVVFDCAGYGLRHLPLCDTDVFKFLLNSANGSYPVRIRAIHVLSCPMAFRFILNLAKSLLSPKMRTRLHVHPSSQNLGSYIDPAILPEEYSLASSTGPFSSERTFQRTAEYHDWLVARSYFGVQDNKTKRDDQALNSEERSNSSADVV